MNKTTKTIFALVILFAFVFVIAAPTYAAVSDKQKNVRVEENEMKERDNRYETEIRPITLTRHTVYDWNGNIVSVRQDPVPGNFTYLFNNWTETNTVSLMADPYFTLITNFIKDVFVYHNVAYQVTWNNTSETLPEPDRGGNGGDGDPVVLDLNNDGKIDVANSYWLPHNNFYRSHMKFFDLTGDGAPDSIEWISENSGDGLLCVPNEDGKVETALDLFGTAEGYEDGLVKLSEMYDKDKNGWVEGAELDGIALWMDKNANGICENGEIKSLSQFNITRICTDKNTAYVGKYETSDGSTQRLWNWWPTICHATRAFQVK